MADENEVRALAQRLAAIPVVGDLMPKDWAKVSREALRWRDETRPLQAPPAAVPWPKADDSAKELGWSWDYKWLESLADAARKEGWDVSMEALDFVLSRIAPQAPPAAPRVERYGDGVLVHWPEGMEQYVCVGDCVTGNLAAAPAAAVPEGYALVPVEPTTAMKCRAVEAWEGPAVYKSMFARGLADLEDKAAECWAAMLAAARKGEP